MISHGKDIKIFTGNANPALAQEICKIIGTKLGEAEVKSFADGEASVSLYETVRCFGLCISSVIMRELQHRLHPFAKEDLKISLI